MPWSINTIPVPHGMAAAVTGSSSPRSAAAASALGPGVSPSLSISSIPPTSSVVGSLNISPSTGGGGGGGASNNKKGFVKTSGNISKSSGDSGVTGGGGGVAGGHVMDHHSSRAGPTDVIGLSAAASRNGVANMAHYDHYLPPPSAAQILVAEELRRARMERIIMADRELEGEQQLRMQQQQHQHQQRERQEQEMDLIRQLGQQRASYYGQAQANVSIYILLIIAKDQCFRIVGIPGQSSSCLSLVDGNLVGRVVYTKAIPTRRSSSSSRAINNLTERLV